MQQKNILITGAAAGIGLGLLKKFMSNGHHVIGVSRNVDNLYTLKQTASNLTIIKADITTDIDQIISKVKNFQEVSIINNAAHVEPTLFNESSLKEIRLHFETNFFAPINLIKSIKSHVKVPRVLSISTGAAFNPFEGLFAYCTSKAAMHHAISCLNLEISDTRFANLRPGMVDTPLQSRLRNTDAFPSGNLFINAKNEHKLISVDKVADFTHWIFQQSDSDFTQNWSIYDTAHQSNWLNGNLTND